MTEKLTIPQLAEKKHSGERLAMVAIGEFLSAQWASVPESILSGLVTAWG
ncbi:MAG: hypothetical protein ACPGVP_20315 [Thiolinea sp.]